MPNFKKLAEALRDAATSAHSPSNLKVSLKEAAAACEDEAPPPAPEERCAKPGCGRASYWAGHRLPETDAYHAFVPPAAASAAPYPTCATHTFVTAQANLRMVIGGAPEFPAPPPTPDRGITTLEDDLRKTRQYAAPDPNKDECGECNGPHDGGEDHAFVPKYFPPPAAASAAPSPEEVDPEMPDTWFPPEQAQETIKMRVRSDGARDRDSAAESEQPPTGKGLPGPPASSSPEQARRTWTLRPTDTGPQVRGPWINEEVTVTELRPGERIVGPADGAKAPVTSWEGVRPKVKVNVDDGQYRGFECGCSEWCCPLHYPDAPQEKA